MALRDRQRREREAERRSMQDSRFDIRGCSAPRENLRKLTEISLPRVCPEEEALAQLILSPDSSEASEGLRDFIDQKRDIFLAQLAIDTQREELQRLERLEREEQEQLNQQETEITLFREQFRAFLDADARSLADAQRAADAMAKQRGEVSQRIRQVSLQNSSLRNNIALYEEKLAECELFRDFIEGLTPPEWRAQHPPPELYFKEPEQMLTIVQTLEEQCTFLIEHCQEAEEAVERAAAAFTQMLEERDVEITERERVRKETRRSLEERRVQKESLKFGGDFRFGNEITTAEFTELLEAISDFHIKLGFVAGATGDVPLMLKRIEHRMEQLTIEIEARDQTVIKDLFVERFHYRRDQERAEKAAQKQKEQEEKTLRALYLAQMPIKRKAGRPLVARSVPSGPDTREKREEQMRTETEQRNADQSLLYGPVWD
jgi:hypothetical protein